MDFEMMIIENFRIMCYLECEYLKNNNLKNFRVNLSLYEGVRLLLIKPLSKLLTLRSSALDFGGKFLKMYSSEFTDILMKLFKSFGTVENHSFGTNLPRVSLCIITMYYYTYCGDSTLQRFSNALLNRLSHLLSKLCYRFLL